MQEPEVLLSNDLRSSFRELSTGWLEPVGLCRHRFIFLNTLLIFLQNDTSVPISVPLPSWLSPRHSIPSCH